MVTCLALVAHFKDVKVSSALELAGEQFTNIRVLAEPPRLS